jgi:serine/threonine-protein kinase
MSELYQLFSEFNPLPLEEQKQEIARLAKKNPQLADELTSLLLYGNTEVSALIEPLYQSLAEQEDGQTRIGRLINNKYKITTLLGQGGMSDVYEAKRIDGLIEHTVAIKYFALADSNNTALNMIKKEAQILANLDHQSIASFIDIGHDNHQEPNIMMEYIDGITLYEFLNTSPSEEAKEQVNSSLKAAIEHAKSKGVEHGDLSKNNVLVDVNGNANIVDFDIASVTDSTIKNMNSLCV